MPQLGAMPSTLTSEFHDARTARFLSRAGSGGSTGMTGSRVKPPNACGKPVESSAERSPPTQSRGACGMTVSICPSTVDPRSWVDTGPSGTTSSADATTHTTSARVRTPNSEPPAESTSRTGFQVTASRSQPPSSPASALPTAAADDDDADAEHGGDDAVERPRARAAR